MKKLLKWILYVFGGFIVLSVIVGIINRIKEPSEAEKVQMTLDSLDKGLINAKKQHIEDSIRDARYNAEYKATQEARQAIQEGKVQEAAPLASGLGVNLKTALEGFNDIEGVKITESPLADGRERTMAQYHSFIMECIGAKENLTSVSLMMMNDGNKQNAALNVLAAQRLFKNVLQSDDLNTFAAAIKEGKSSFVVGGRTVKLANNDIGEIKATTLTIE